MKQLLFLLLFSCIANFHSLQAQTTFAPVGAEWHNTTGNCGTMYAYYAGDTTISGISCRRIARETHIDSLCYIMGIYSSALPSLYVYSNSDTVFVYNKFFNRFTPLYVFNVSDGDTVRLPILSTEGGGLRYAVADSSFTYVVDSVRIKRYDTANLKTVYTRSLGYAAAGLLQDRYVYSYGAVDTLGVYAARIGAVSTGFFPRCATCAYITENVFEDSLRCYNDITMSVKLTADSCDITPYAPEAIAGIKQNSISIFPNPANGVLHINNLEATSYYLLLNAVGSVVQQGILGQGDNDISVGSLPDGFYLLKVYQNGKRTDIVKVVKQ